MTNFRLFQTERVCRRQFQIWRKWRKVFQTGRKHGGKRRNCSLRAISPFPTVFSKGLFPRGIKVSLCGNGLSPIFKCLQYKYFENTVGKEEITPKKQFLLFPQCFPTHLKNFLPFSSNLNLSSANSLNLDWSRFFFIW